MTADTDAPPSTFCQDAFERAESLLAKNDRPGARTILESIVLRTEMTSDDIDEVRAKEQAIYSLTTLYVARAEGEALIALLSGIRDFFSFLPKAKATRMVSKIFENIVLCGVPLDQQKKVCDETIEWTRQEKRTFLRHRLQLRLAEVQFELRDPRTALMTLVALLREVRRLDDRALLLDIHLLESKIYYSIRNSSKARASLVSARTTANSIYCPPLAQAEIDLQSGVLHTEEHDYKTAFSYLFEAFEGFHQLGNQAQLARKALHYMVLAKIFSDNVDELQTVLASKNVLEYAGEDMVILRGIADAYVRQDTHAFNQVLSRAAASASSSPDQQPATRRNSNNMGEPGTTNATPADSAAALLRDEVIGRQLREMYDTLVERHLLKVIRPYNRVQIAFLASLLQLDPAPVEARVSQLILDKKLAGIVDQQHACLVVFDEVERKKASAVKKEDDNPVYDNAADQAAAELAEKTTLHQDARTALERYDALVTALFDKVGGKFDGLVEDRIAKRAEKEKEKDDRKKKATGGGGADDKTDKGNSDKDKGDKAGADAANKADEKKDDKTKK